MIVPILRIFEFLANDHPADVRQRYANTGASDSDNYSGNYSHARVHVKFPPPPARTKELSGGAGVWGFACKVWNAILEGFSMLGYNVEKI
jgi:hypothetical protein